MPILVPSDESNNIEVSISYIDRGASGVKIFDDEEEKAEWIERETERRNSKRVELTAAGDPIPDSLREEAKEDVKELKTWWKRADWGTQSSIVHSAQSVDGKSGVSIHAPRAGGDEDTWYISAGKHVSIHAPRAGGDVPARAHL